jgi:hypothetical protein
VASEEGADGTVTETVDETTRGTYKFDHLPAAYTAPDGGHYLASYRVELAKTREVDTDAAHVADDAKWLLSRYHQPLRTGADLVLNLAEGVVGLSQPFKVYDLINTVEMMLKAQQRRRRKRREEAKRRNPAQRAVIEKAKSLLMERNNLTEEEAHRYLQKNSMESGTNMLETARMVLTIMGE